MIEKHSLGTAVMMVPSVLDLTSHGPRIVGTILKNQKT
jgi:hypothetical protein